MNNHRLAKISGLSGLILAALLLASTASAQEVKFSVLLHPRMAAALGIAPRSGFDLDSTGDAYFRSGREIYDLNGKSFLEPSPLPFNDLSDFCLAGDQVVVAIHGAKLAVIRDGSATDYLDLPVTGMKIAHTDPNRIWLFGGDQAPNTGLYLLMPDGQHQKFLEADHPITAVAGEGDTIYFSVGTLIYRAQFGHKLTLVAALPGSPITSLAYDPDLENLFIAQGKSVLILGNGESKLLARGLGEQLRFQNGNLYAYSPEDQTLVRIEGYMDLRNPEADAAPAQPAAPKPTLAQVYYQQATEKANAGKNLQAYWLLKQTIQADPDWAEPYYTAGVLCEHLGYTRDFRFIGQAAKFYQGFLDHSLSSDYRRQDVSSKIETLTYIDQWLPASAGGKYVTPQEVGAAGGAVLLWSLLCMFLFF